MFHLVLGKVLRKESLRLLPSHNRLRLSYLSTRMRVTRLLAPRLRRLKIPVDQLQPRLSLSSQV